METYQGVKFNHQQIKPNFEFDKRLTELNLLTYLLSQLGLTPVHPEGAYGNQSYRSSQSSFIITKSGMLPSRSLDPTSYCEIIGYDARTTTFSTNGSATPSSESFLHNEIYSSLPQIHVILHGHSNLLNDYAEELNIPVTDTFYDYGTQELAQSALVLARKGSSFFILKDHGFVALGCSIKSTGNLVLDYYGQLINLLKS
ncbi:MAG: ribulose-5-phosphate 4-epimerase/fuculose-1-phosphate aldolase [Desulforhopalus sp.]|jgi:ribulose-5-phosphate 4-epimerase/fuculose-1-phosphate aldolase